ncbi:MAG: DUF1415 domain-containing protein [Gammaproteobacteria bacterium]|nr:DUF1415 domain-containing protein [Gammaproteobacteria bacterium]
MVDEQQAERQTRRWVEQVIVGLNFCPFAKNELVQNTLRISVSDATTMEAALHRLADEWRLMDEDGNIETTLLVFSHGFERFDDFLTLLDYADRLLEMQGYVGTYQLAHFHPDYCFADSDATDAANYTNRSPCPTLHIIREASMEEVLRRFPNPEAIPVRNMELARSKGLEVMREILAGCIAGEK